MKDCAVRGLILPALAVFVFMFAYEYVVHGVLLLPLYDQTPQLWRSMADYGVNMHWALFRQVMLSLLIAFLFTRNYEGKGLLEGVRFGVYVGLLLGIHDFGSYAWMPISLTLAWMWLAAGLFLGVGAGVVLALVHGGKKGCCPHSAEKKDAEAR